VSKVRRRRTLEQIVLFSFVFVGIVLTLAYAALNTPRTAAEKKLLANLKQGQGELRSFNSLDLPFEWDTVCYLDPYSFPSQRLPGYLPDVGRNLVYKPEDRYIDEEEHGLTFIDRKGRTAHVLLIDIRELNRIVGPRCLDRTNASFRIERIAGANLTYDQLTFVRVDTQ
jgi:hypothetical protein